MKCCLAVALGFAVAGCSKDCGHKKVQLWKNGPYWAETNIGAEKPWDYGYYFWWGDTIGYKRVNDAWVASDGSSSDFLFDTENVPTWDMSEVDLMKEGWVKTDMFRTAVFLSPEHDAAHVHWGGEWRMPTEMEISDLVKKCDWTWTEIKGVWGYVVRGKGAYASASIFLPAAGHGDRKSLKSSGWAGDYWSSWVPGRGTFSTALYFYSDRYDKNDYNGRGKGCPVRPVQSAANSAGGKGQRQH